MKKIILPITTIMLLVISFFWASPALNLTSPGLYFFALWTVFLILVNLLPYLESINLNIIITVICVMVGIVIIIGLLGCTGSNFKKSAQLLDITEYENIEEAIPNTSIEMLPQMDQDSARLIANRKISEIPGVLNQYKISKNICNLTYYNGIPHRIIPLEYTGFYNYIVNNSKSVPGYMLVNVVSQEAEFIKVNEGIKYFPKAFLFENLKIHIHRQYPNAILGEYNFEIDDNVENGHTPRPYWVVPKIKYNSTIGNLPTIDGYLVVDAITGHIEPYENDEDLPKFVLRAIDTNITIKQIKDWAKFKNGFFNLSKKDKKKVSDSYNFVTLQDGIYLYKGITPYDNNVTNIGFMLVNTRTGKAKYINFPHESDNVARRSVEAALSEKGYTSTDPIFTIINDVPVYSLSLKDSNGLIKRYAFVDATDSQKYGYSDEFEDISKAFSNLIKVLKKDVSVDNKDKVMVDKSITIQNLFMAIIEGNSEYYIVYEDKVYIAPISINKILLPTLVEGNKVFIKGYESEDHFSISEISLSEE